MPKKRIFTEEDIQNIIKWYTLDNYTIHYIAKNILKCRESSVSKILKDNKITINNKKKSRNINKKQEEEIIDLYVNKKYNQKQIAEKFGCSTFIIHNILKENNIKLVTQPKINREQNEYYFDIIDTEHKAYWLGFLFADGNVYKNCLTIEIHEKDKELLEIFKQDLQLNGKISFRQRKNTSICSVRMVSTHLCETLSQYGIVQNKTYITKHLPNISQNLLPHFLRGLIDGDGWITKDKNNRYHIGFVSNFQSTCEDFKRYCNLITNGLCKAKVIKKGNNSGYYFQIQSKEATKQLATALYKDNTICLSRKYRMAEPLFDFKNDEDIV